MVEAGKEEGRHIAKLPQTVQALLAGQVEGLVEQEFMAVVMAHLPPPFAPGLAAVVRVGILVLAGAALVVTPVVPVVPALVVVLAAGRKLLIVVDQGLAVVSAF